jgi:hypothetical protein
MLSTFVRNLFEEREAQIRNAELSINGNTGLLCWIWGNAIKTKKFQAVELAEHFKSLEIIDYYTCSPAGIELFKINYDTISFGKHGRPIQTKKVVKVNWDEVKITHEAATSLAAIEEMPIHGFDLKRFIRRGIKKGCLAALSI